MTAKSADRQTISDKPFVQRKTAGGDPSADKVDEALKEVASEVKSDSAIELVTPRRPRPIRKTILCITLPFSPAVELEGKVIDLGDGAPDDFEQRADEIKGNIVMTNSVFNPKKSIFRRPIFSTSFTPWCRSYA